MEAATLLKTDPGLRPVSLDHGLETERRDSNLLADEDTGRAELEDVTNVEEDEDVTMSQVSRCHETGMWLSGVSHVTSCYAVTRLPPPPRQQCLQPGKLQGKDCK